MDMVVAFPWEHYGCYLMPLLSSTNMRRDPYAAALPTGNVPISF